MIQNTSNFFFDLSSTTAHIFQKQVLDCQVFKLQRYSSMSLHLSPKI